MPERANVTSVEAIAAFRTSLLVYLSKARPALEEAGGEVLRLRLWLENDQKTLWSARLNRSNRKLEEAEAALFSAKLSKFEEASAAQQAAVQKARHAVAEAEEKMRTIRRWDRDYENRTEPLLKQQEKLSNLLALDIPNAVATLTGVIDILQKYADVHNPSASAPAPPVGDTPAISTPGDAGETPKTGS